MIEEHSAHTRLIHYRRARDIGTNSDSSLKFHEKSRHLYDEQLLVVCSIND